MRSKWVPVMLCSLFTLSVPAAEYDPSCDLNGDGVVDSGDLFIFQGQWHGIRPTETMTPTVPSTPTVTPTPTPVEIVIDLPGLPAGAMPPVMVEIPPGSFAMGSPPGELSRLTNEGPVHTVTIAAPFYLGKYEVTQAQWRAVTGENPSFFSACGDDCPVESVSWEDCQGFVSAMNGLGQGIFRLPSEAEWEYACRAGTGTRYFFGDSLACADDCSDCTVGARPGNRTDYMWYCGNNTVYGTKSVGTKLANVFGLFDTHGNVYEWCRDWYHGTYDGAPDDGSAWEEPAGASRVRRGGGWYYGANVARSASRDALSPGTRSASVGFRLARDY